MSEDRKPFTITDRRHFTADGQARAEAEEPAPAEPRRKETPPPEPGPQASGPHEMDFAGFLLTLGAQASALLNAGGEKDAGRSLREARSIISILEMLKGKTEGRRTPEEDEILDGLLYELRMAYVERSRVSAP